MNSLKKYGDIYSDKEKDYTWVLVGNPRVSKSIYLKLESKTYKLIYDEWYNELGIKGLDGNPEDWNHELTLEINQLLFSRLKKK